MRKHVIEKEYERQKKSLGNYESCAHCGEMLACYDAHHIAGRGGFSTLLWVPMCRRCHSAIHDDPQLGAQTLLYLPMRRQRSEVKDECIEMAAWMEDEGERVFAFRDFINLDGGERKSLVISEYLHEAWERCLASVRKLTE